MTDLGRTDYADFAVDEALAWIVEQAEGIMATTAGGATAEGDPHGVLQMVNSMASDIAINAAIAMETRKGGNEVPSQSDDSAGLKGIAQ